MAVQPMPSRLAVTTQRGFMKLVAIDGDARSREIIEAAVAQEGLEVITASTSEDGWNLICQHHPQMVILDLLMPGDRDMQFLERIVEWDPGLSVILLTRDYSTEYAVEAIRKGACDYLTKPVAISVLRERVQKLLRAAQERRQAMQLDKDLLEAYRFESLVGRSPQMLELFGQIRRVAPHFRTALVTGATGTGKELVAHALHRLSPVAGERFVICNCSSIVETLFESELFGCVKGAFTGATQDRPGLCEYAQGGTLFLDEIGEVSIGIQSKLLRLLQNQEIQRVGSPVTRKLNVHVIAATNRDLRSMVDRGRFRQDLYYRLCLVELKMPRLADRKEDLPLLSRHFVEQFSKQFGKPIKGLSRRAQTLLSRFSWPGNVRELENVIGHGAMMTQSDVIDVRDLPEYLRAQDARTMNGEDLLSLAEVERRHAQYVLERVGGNKAQAAEILGVSRTTLYRILQEPVMESDNEASREEGGRSSTPAEMMIRPLR